MFVSDFEFNNLFIHRNFFALSNRVYYNDCMIGKINQLAENYLKDAVYAASDGIVTTFAIVAGVVGASLSPLVVLILGFANVLADGISMAAGNYLGSKSESDQYESELAREEKIFNNSTESAEREVKEIFGQKGYNPEDAEAITPIIIKNKKFFLDFIIFERKGLSVTTNSDAMKASVVTLVAFIIAGIIPLLPFVFLYDSVISNQFMYASIFAGGAMFLVGSARTMYSDKKWWAGGLEMLFVAGLAAVVAYIVGDFLSGLVN